MCDKGSSSNSLPNSIEWGHRHEIMHTIQQLLNNASPVEAVFELPDPKTLTMEKIVQECLNKYISQHELYLTLYAVAEKTPGSTSEKQEKAHQHAISHSLEYLENLCKMSTLLASDNYEIVKQDFATKVQELQLMSENKYYSLVTQLADRFIQELKRNFETDISLRFHKLVASEITPKEVITARNITKIKFYSHAPLKQCIKDRTSIYLNRCSFLQQTFLDESILQNDSLDKDRHLAHLNTVFNETKQWLQDKGIKLLSKNITCQQTVVKYINKSVSRQYKTCYDQFIKSLKTELYSTDIEFESKLVEAVTCEYLRILRDCLADCSPILERQVETTLQEKGSEYIILCKKDYQLAMQNAVQKLATQLGKPYLANATRKPLFKKQPEIYGKLFQKNLEKAIERTNREFEKHVQSRNIIQTSEVIAGPPMPPVLPSTSANIGANKGLKSLTELTSTSTPREKVATRLQKRNINQQNSTQKGTRPKRPKH